MPYRSATLLPAATDMVAPAWRRSPPPHSPAALRASQALQCLRCQLLGRRRLACAHPEGCCAVRSFHPLGPILVAGWLATAVAFAIAVW